MVFLSGLNEIIQWVEENYDFEAGEDVQKAFEQIDKAEDWRAPLADILGDQLPNFMEYLEQETHTTREDLIIRELEGAIADAERELSSISGRTINFLGTPIR